MFLHLELTTRCILACPGCARTQWSDLLKRPVQKFDLDYHALDKFLDCEQGQKIDGFVLCGDYGDPIYYPQLFEFLDHFRATKKFNLHTNGSHRNQEFWHRLAGTLNQNDRIIFGIDGLEDTNHIYRINSDWHSIMTAVDTMAKSSTQVTWQTIVFKYNYQHLEQIKEFATQKGCKFTAEKTHRFGNNELAPPDNFIEINHSFNDRFVHEHDIEIDPSCEREKVISANGFMYPCDWIRNPKTLYKSLLWKQKEKWLDKLDIRTTTYDQAMVVVRDWADWVRESSLLQRSTVDVLCKMKCRKNCQQNKFLEI